MLIVYPSKSPLSLVWMFIGCVYKDVYLQVLNVCPFDYIVDVDSGKVGLIDQVNPISWLAVVTPSDRPKSIYNRCVIISLGGVFVLSVTLLYRIFCW